MPDPYGGFLNGLSVLALDVVQVLPFNCVSGQTFGHFEGLVAVTVFPIVVLVIGMAGLVVSFKILGKKKIKKRNAFTLFLQVLLLMLPAISRRIFQSFRCDEFNLGGESLFLLASDHEIDCEGLRYTSIVSFAFAFVLVYPIGTPLVFLLLLGRFRHRLDPVGVAEAQVVARRIETPKSGWGLAEDTGKFDQAMAKCATKDLFENEPITQFALPYRPRFWYIRAWFACTFILIHSYKKTHA